jgi:hypothetical protein
MPFKCENEKCGQTFVLPGKIVVEKVNSNGFPNSFPGGSGGGRTITEKPCCPHCDGLNFVEVIPK